MGLWSGLRLCIVIGVQARDMFRMAANPIWSRALAQRDFQADISSMSARLDKFHDREPVRGPTPIDAEADQPRWPHDSPVPEVSAEEFDVAKLRSAMATSGSLIVRGFMDIPTTRYYKSVIDGVLSTCYLPKDDRPEITSPRAAFYNPPPQFESPSVHEDWRHCRYFHRTSGSAMCIEVSSVAEQLLELYEQMGLRELVTDYLGEAPCLSAQKWVLRRSLLPVQSSGWHQDGAFMGADINSINMWITLDECGAESGAPGLDVVPKRLTEIFKPGAGGAMFDWSAGEQAIEEAFGKNVVVSPLFNAGDAYFFDHFFLHRTQYRESFTKLRYAIENWFFGSDNFSKDQFPLAW